MLKKTVSLLLVTILLVTATPVMGGDLGEFASKAEKIAGEAGKLIGAFEQIIQAFSKISGETNKVGRVFDPKMDPNYVKLRQGEIERQRQRYLEAKKEYENSGWYEFIDKPARKKRMEEEERKWRDEQARWEQEKYKFKKKVADETSNVSIFRKPDRNQQKMEQFDRYMLTVMENEKKKLDKARKAYEDCWGIRFLKKARLKKEYEAQKKRYNEQLAKFEKMLDGEVLSPWGYVSSSELKNNSGKTKKYQENTKKNNVQANDWAGKARELEKMYQKNRNAIFGSSAGQFGGVVMGPASGPGTPPFVPETISHAGYWTGQFAGHGVDRKVARRKAYVEGKPVEKTRAKTYRGRSIGIDTSDDM